jgi:hypothetical protein
MTTKLRRRHLVFTIGMTLLIGACSGASVPAATSAPNGTASAPSQQAPIPAAAGPTGPAADGSSACALLTKAEVEAAFKETMLEPVSSVDHGDATCTYAHEAGGLDLTVAISSRPSSAATIKSMEGVYGDTSTDVPGVGDAAFEVAGILEFVKGTTLVIIGSGDGPAIISDDDFKALTKMAAGRV